MELKFFISLETILADELEKGGDLIHDNESSYAI